MEDYFLAKRRLFTAAGEPPRLSMINVADPYGRALAAEVAGAVTFAVEARRGLQRQQRCAAASSGCRFTLRTPAGGAELALPMPGRFNVANALGALAVAHASAATSRSCSQRCERGVRVPGRFEPVDEGQDFAVIVDYAHTPDSLENVLARGRRARRAGRPRDLRVRRRRRPRPRQAAADGRDRRAARRRGRSSPPTIPRSEDPEAIIAEIIAGRAPGAAPGDGIGDRRERDRRGARRRRAGRRAS